ncbi:MAG: FAD-dependent oxidoreductase, partial [Actinobacteria bacterium]|nr:FAD-dependent oxidoreductase [Actinomycetota bacterium]
MGPAAAGIYGLGDTYRSSRRHVQVLSRTRTGALAGTYRCSRGHVQVLSRARTGPLGDLGGLAPLDFAVRTEERSVDYSSATIVGGGIVGLAVAYRLSELGVEVTVVEKEHAWAAHQTGHNSGVIHAGPYYRPGSLKATMCTAGNASMVAFATEHGLRHEVCGKLIVATEESQLPGLRTLYERGQANGTPCELVSAERAAEIEPHVNAVAALHVHSTGIIDYAEVSA